MNIQPYQNLTQCSNATGVPFDVLILAKNHKDSPKGLYGFSDGGRIYWNVPNESGITLEKWVNTHLEELTSVDGEDLQYWKLRRERANALKAEIDLEEKKGSIVSRQTVKELLDRIATAQVSLFNGKLRQELPARFNLTPEQIQVLDGMITEVFTVLQKPVDQWK
jgi:hypothetical protein